MRHKMFTVIVQHSNAPFVEDSTYKYLEITQSLHIDRFTTCSSATLQTKGPRTGFESTAVWSQHNLRPTTATDEASQLADSAFAGSQRHGSRCHAVLHTGCARTYAMLPYRRTQPQPGPSLKSTEESPRPYNLKQKLKNPQKPWLGLHLHLCASVKSVMTTTSSILYQINFIMPIQQYSNILNLYI